MPPCRYLRRDNDHREPSSQPACRMDAMSCVFESSLARCGPPRSLCCEKSIKRVWSCLGTSMGVGGTANSSSSGIRAKFSPVMCVSMLTCCNRSPTLLRADYRTLLGVQRARSRNCRSMQRAFTITLNLTDHTSSISWSHLIPHRFLPFYAAETV